jgi:hypothetical protein
VGTVAALAATALWLIFLFRNPYATESLTDAELLFGLLAVSGSAVAAAVAALGAHLGMYLLFFILFMPAGATTILSGGFFQAIGWLELLYLGAAVLVHRAVSSSRSSG